MTCTSTKMTHPSRARQGGRVRAAALLAAALICGPVAARAQDTTPAAHHRGGADSMMHGGAMGHDTGYAHMQMRGAHVMGVDQYTSHHRFVDLPDGGRIELQRDVPDTAGAARIRAHMREIASMFATGDFRDPMLVHDEHVPGTGVMAARRALIRYTPYDLPRGGGVRITTRDAAALRAVHEFLAFQRAAHHAPGAAP